MSAEFPVVAFLQNCWFRPGTNPEVIRRYLTDQKFRRIVLSRSMSGSRLLRAFGADHYRRIWWDNASEYVANTSPGRADADIKHMTKVIQKIDPIAVLVFGNVAHQGIIQVEDLWNKNLDKIFPHGDCDPEHVFPNWKFFPHPNARGLTQAQLNAFAAEIISRYF